MVKKFFTLLVLLSLILFSANKALGQWNIFGEERAERFSQPKDSTDIYKTIEEKFGTEEKEMVQGRLSKRLYKNFTSPKILNSSLNTIPFDNLIGNLLNSGKV